MRIKQTFFVTFFLFLVVWGFFSYLPEVRQNPRIEIPDQVPLLNTQLQELSPPSTNQFWSHFQHLAESGKVARVEQIDRQIEELENLKRGYLSRANRFDDQAERLQFQDRSLLESRRFSELAQENRDKAQRTQEEIDRLTTERKKLTQEKK
jgi:hypothetical protein